MQVRDLMSTPAVSCREGYSLSTAVRLMRDRDCGALPVVDDDDRIIGIITDRDVCMAAYTKRRLLDDLSVAEITRGDVFSVAPGDTLQRAERVMAEHQVRRLPVVDANDSVVGVLSLNDIVREGQRERSLTSKELHSDEVLQTLAQICQPSLARPRPID